MEKRLEELLAGVVACDSVNPAWEGGPGEADVCRHISDVLSSAGLNPEIQEVKSGRANVVCTIAGNGSASALMLNAHLDVVGVEGMDAPFTLRRDGDKLYGRGAYDMKGSAAIMLALGETLATESPPGDVHLTFVCDEEDLSIGMEHLMGDWFNFLVKPPCIAIILEPTEEQIGICHKGFGWYEIAVTGKAAHGSRPEEGVDAITPLGAVINEIKTIGEELSAVEPHPLLGYSSLHVGTVKGGINLPVIAAESRIDWERRILPGETEGQLDAEFERVVLAARGAVAGATIEAKKLFSRPPMETPESAEIVRRFRSAAPEAQLAGMSYWADSALAAKAGIPSVLYGPIGHGAHAIDEWVSASSLQRIYETVLAVILGMRSAPD
ncbi:MAG: M20/M25/M40 family metallo-hydrolase [Candidatus Neomarinimicrobiota bacterium]|nr:M20/M25/M40 family metallo-hydrolase [Candidatus Neomarinimicrobiota bacterium]